MSQIVKRISYAISLFNTLSKIIELYNSNKPVTIAYWYYTIVSDVHKYHTGDVDQASSKNIARKTYN